MKGWAQAMNRNDLSESVRQSLHRFDPPFEAHYGVLPPRPPEDSVPLEKVAVPLANAHGALKEASVLARELPDQYILSRIPMRMEALSSSSIEGTNSTLDELLEVEEDDADATDAASQVRDYAIALERILPLARKKGREIFTLDLISQLHAATLQSDKAYPDVPGEFRKRVVWIGHGNIAQSTYNPPAPQYVQSCMQVHVAYLQADGMQAMTQDFITRMAIAHAHFEGVHPFRDGNGRVGRLLLAVMMAAEGHEPVYLSPFIEASKQRYYDALKAAQALGDYSPLTILLADAVTETVHEFKRLRGDLKSLRDQWLTRFSFRAGSAALATLNLLHEYPVLTIRRLEQLLGVSFPAASGAVERLIQTGILVEKTGYARNRIFTAPEAVKLLNRPFGETYEPASPGF